jgi:hypothetical protein
VGMDSRRPGLSNVCSILLREGWAYHSIAVFISTFFANFRESPKGEVRE